MARLFDLQISLCLLWSITLCNTKYTLFHCFHAVIWHLVSWFCVGLINRIADSTFDVDSDNNSGSSGDDSGNSYGCDNGDDFSSDNLITFIMLVMLAAVVKVMMMMTTIVLTVVILIMI